MLIQQTLPTKRTPLKVAFLVLALLLLALTLGPGSKAAKRSARITVFAGALDRRESIVTFDWPTELQGTSYALQDESSRMISLQIDSQHKATFVLTSLPAGTTKSYRLIAVENPVRAAKDAGVHLTQNDNRLDLKLSQRQVFSFVGKPGALPANDIKPVFLRGGYIYPIYTPSGRLVTDDYPPDHYHHHGIWFAWTKTRFEGGHPDFWNMGDGTGRVDFEAIDESWSGPVDAGFKSRQQYVALTGPAPTTALHEEWDVRLYNVGQNDRRYFMFDIVATQQLATSSPLTLEEYRYGGMGFRGHRDWKDKSKVFFLTSEGKTRSDGNATRGRWCSIWGLVDGRLAGITILSHPSNFRSPQPMRLNPDDPFFNYAPSQAGEFEIKPGEKFVLRYRFVVADGAPDATVLDRMWNDYADAPRVVVNVN